MRTLLILIISLTFFSSCKDKNTEVTQQVSSVDSSTKSQGNVPDELKEEDCDEKAKKVEQEAIINLENSGDAGCSIDDLKTEH